VATATPFGDDASARLALGLFPVPPHQKGEKGLVLRQLMNRGHVLKLEFSILGMMWPGDDQQASPPETRRASPPVRHSAAKTADKKIGGQARQRRTDPRSIDNRPEN